MAKSKHDKGLEEIVRRPEIICARTPLFSCKDIILYNKNKYIEPDILLYDGRYYLVEFKSTEWGENKAKEQLKKYDNFLRNKVGVHASKVFAYYENKEIQWRYV